MARLLFWLIIGERRGATCLPNGRSLVIGSKFLLFAKVLFGEAKKPDEDQYD